MLKGNFPVATFQTLRTPFYYYDVALLQKTLSVIKTEAAKYDYLLHYAVKANANPRILSIIADAGLGVDCVSGGEIEAALRAGFPAEQIVFAGVGKADWEIALAMDNHIACFNVESDAELENLNNIAADKGQTAPVALRFNPDINPHTLAKITTGMKENKFGIDRKHLLCLLNNLPKLKHIRLLGLHAHIGSQISDLSAFQNLARRFNDLQNELENRGLHIQHINLGGGLAVDYDHPNHRPIPDFDRWFQTFHQYLQRRPGQIVHFEPGRSIVAQCGALITKILYVKEGATKRFAILDAGFTDLLRPALYNAQHRIENLSNNLPVTTYDIVGPICESSDVFAHDAELNATQRGDLLAIRSAGAYGEAMTSSYNCRQRPVAYFSDKL